MSAGARIRVMHVITGLGVGGAESALCALVTAPPSNELEQSVVSLTAGGIYSERIRQAGVPVASLGMRPGFPTPGALLALARRIRNERPDVVQGWMYHADLMATFAVWFSGRRRHSALIWGLRTGDLAETDYGHGFRLVRRLWLWLGHCADLIVANTEAGLEAHLAWGLQPRASRVIANGIDTGRFQPDPRARARLRREWGIPDHLRLLVHVARVDPVKDHPTFLAAMGRLPHARAVLVGRDTDKLALPPNVIALGQREDVPTILAAADIVVSSSLGEGFSNVLAEGMAAGLPAVATDVGGARAILGDGGALCPAGDPAAMARAIQRLLDEPPAQWKARCDAARHRIVENFSLERAAMAFARVYREAAAAKSA